MRHDGNTRTAHKNKSASRNEKKALTDTVTLYNTGLMTSDQAKKMEFIAYLNFLHNLFSE